MDPLLIWLIFVVGVGACVGSFLNVVAYRLPEGKSIVTPPSACPRCGHHLAWYDNIPVLGWVMLRGRCRYCREPISVQYPLVEAATAALFGGVYVVYYMTDLRPGLADAGPGATWPVLVMHLVLIAGLIAATLIDARLYIIPLQIPWLVTVVAVVGLPAAVALGWQPVLPGVVPAMGPGALAAALGALAGLGVAVALLLAGLLPRSFDEAELEDDAPAPATTAPATPATEAGGSASDPESWLAHPHPRREVLKELLFLAPPAAGALLGWRGVTPLLPTPDALPAGWSVLAGVLMGYLVGGALVWVVRVLGTLVFGKEAIGLGDVHLLGAIGAVLGAIESVFVFFAAPFFGLAAILLITLVSSVAGRQIRVIPYGPYLAAGALFVMVFREPLISFFVIV
ncbi:MAG: prepilin peptidase [Phycisphaeraceae bacterium]